MYPLYFFLLVLGIALVFAVRVGRTSLIAGIFLGIAGLPGALFATFLYDELIWANPQADALCDDRYAAIAGDPPCAPQHERQSTEAQALQQLSNQQLTPLN